MRKAKPKKRILLPDPKFNDVMVTRFVNNLMLDGKKSIAYEIFYDSLELVGKKMKDADKSPLEVWKQALENITPQVEVKSKRIGGATFQVPTEVRPERKISISMKNLVLYSRKRAGKSMAEKLSGEIVAGCRLQTQGGDAPHGRGQQGIRTLQILITGRTNGSKRLTLHSQYRYHGSHRCR